jgi:tRNA G18 (ribose-2'-O)-methylase SpoU
MCTADIKSNRFREMRKLRNNELGRLSTDDFKKSDKTPLIIVADNVRSFHNVGSLFRTADCFRAAHIYLCGLTPTPGSADMQKTALGATESMDWTHVESTVECIKSLQNDGYTVVALEQAEGSIDLREYVPQGPTALVFGHEVVGVAQEVVNACDAIIEIAQFGTKHSLNVSVSAGIAMFEIHKKLTR